MARAMVATDLREGMAELGQQIAKIKVALNKASQGNSPSSALSSPWKRGHKRGHNGSNIPSNPNSNTVRSGPGQATPAYHLPTWCVVGAPEV